MSDKPVMIDLKPDRKLLDPQFDSYKLSLDPVPTHRTGFSTGVDHVVPCDDQYSFLHAKVFGLHNHLHGDPWSEGGVYFIDQSWKVQKSIQDAIHSATLSLLEVCEVPSHHERKPGHYNLSLSFSSSDLAVIADGAGTLHIVHTGNRSDLNCKWEVVFSTEPIGKEEPFIVVESQVVGNQLHCILLHVKEEEVFAENSTSEEKNHKSVFVSVMHWITFEEDRGNWSISSLRQMIGRGGVDFASFEKNCTAVYVASDHSFQFVSDKLESAEKNERTNESEAKSQKIFSWLQTGDDLTLWLPLPSDASKSDLSVTITPLALRIELRGSTVLEGDLHQRVDVDLTCWTVSTGKLELVLSKVESGVAWPEVLVNDKRGEEIMDPAFVEEVHQRLAHLCSETVETAANGSAPSFNSQQLEECDALPRDTAVLLRLDASSCAVSHQVNLGGHQWLFNARLRSEGPQAICLRHDVDACLWEMDEVDVKTNMWPVTHVGTFHAFGYVQASKQQRKFSACSPDMSFVAICDATRHIYLYRQPGAVGSELRNRTTGQRVAQVAKQQIFQLDNSSTVLGCYATNRELFILTSDMLYKFIVAE